MWALQILLGEPAAVLSSPKFADYKKQPPHSALPAKAVPAVAQSTAFNLAPSCSTESIDASRPRTGRMNGSIHHEKLSTAGDRHPELAIPVAASPICSDRTASPLRNGSAGRSFGKLSFLLDPSVIDELEPPPSLLPAAWHRESVVSWPTLLGGSTLVADDKRCIMSESLRGDASNTWPRIPRLSSSESAWT